MLKPRKNRKTRMLFFIASLALVICLWVMDFPGKSGTWTLEDWKVHEEIPNAEGLAAIGPGLNLAAGRYRFEWKVDVEGTGEIRLFCGNGVRIEPDRIPLVRDDSWGETWVTLPEPVHHFYANVAVEEGKEYEVHSLRLSSPRYKDHIVVIALILGAVTLLWPWNSCGTGNEKKERILVLAATVLFASVPIWGNSLPDGADLRFHLSRLVNLSQGLRDLQIPVRIGDFSYNGYGAVTSVFYPDLFLVPSALLLLGGCSLTFAVQMYMVFNLFLCAWLTYHSARWILKSHQAALCTMILYVLGSYQMMETHTVMRIGGQTAVSFLPLFFAGLYEVLLGDWRRWPYVVLAAAGIAESHVMTTYLTAGFSGLVVLLNCRNLIRDPARIMAMGKALLLASCVCAFSLVPLIQCLAGGEYTGVVQFGFSRLGAELKRLLDPVNGLGMMLVLGMFAYLAIRGADRVLDQMLMLSILAVFLASEWFPWSLAERVLGQRVTVIQFPARFLIFAAMMLSFVGGWTMDRILQAVRPQAFAILALSVLFLVPVYQRIETWPRSIRTGEWASPILDTPEYQLIGTDLGKMVTRNIELEGKGQIEDYTRVSTGARMRVQAEEDMRVSLPILAFPYYRLTLDGQSIPYERGENNRVTFTVPKGTEGQLLLRFEEPLLWRVCEGISLAGAILLCALLYGMRKRGAGNRAAG